MKLLPRWRQFLHRNKSKSTIFMEALASMSDFDIAKITEDALGCRLPQFEDANVHKPHLNPRTLREVHDASSGERRSKEPPIPLAAAQTASSAASRAESHENPRKISDRAMPSSPKRGERHSNSTTGKKFEKSNFELQEVVIDGIAGVGTQQVVPVVHHGSDDDRAALSLNPNSSDHRNAVIPVKTVGAVASEQRGKGVARSLKAITRRPNQFPGLRSEQEPPSTSVHVENGQSTAGIDCVVAAHHVPRSRSGVRIRSSATADSMSADQSARHIIFTAAARTSEQSSQSSSSHDIPALVTSATAAPFTAPRLSQRSRSQFQSTVPETGFPKRDAVEHRCSAETADVASSVALFNLPQAPPRSRAKSRGRATEALRELATKDRLEDAASAALSCTEMSFSAPPQSITAPGLQEQAHSHKNSSKKTTHGPPPMSIVRKAGADFEEC